MMVLKVCVEIVCQNSSEKQTIRFVFSLFLFCWFLSSNRIISQKVKAEEIQFLQNYGHSFSEQPFRALAYPYFFLSVIVNWDETFKYETPCNLILFFAGSNYHWWSSKLSKLPSDIVKKMGLWLGQMYLLSNRNMLGNKTTQMGTKCKHYSFKSFLLTATFSFLNHATSHLFTGSGGYVRRLQMYAGW